MFEVKNELLNVMKKMIHLSIKPKQDHKKL